MKKLLLMLLLMFSVTLSAQTIRESYNSCIITYEDGSKSDWLNANFTLVIYDELKIDFEVKDKVIKFDITDAFKGVTQGGFTYYQLELVEQETKEVVDLQVFDDESYGVRVFIRKLGQSFQYTK